LPLLRIHIRKDPSMEKVALISSELVSIPYEFQGSFSGISSIEEIAKVLRSLLEAFRFEKLKSC